MNRQEKGPALSIRETTMVNISTVCRMVPPPPPRVAAEFAFIAAHVLKKTN